MCALTARAVWYWQLEMFFDGAITLTRVLNIRVASAGADADLRKVAAAGWQNNLRSPAPFTHAHESCCCRASKVGAEGVLAPCCFRCILGVCYWQSARHGLWGQLESAGCL